MQDSLLRRNLVANFLGRGASAIIALVAIPIYIHLLGIEAFGLVGFFTTVLALSTVFDFGLSATANREVAKLTAAKSGTLHARDLIRSMEFVYWLFGLIIALLAILGAGSIARFWLQPADLSSDIVEDSVRLMFIVLAVHFPVTFYSGCLLGLQRHVLLNFVTVMGALAAAGTTVLVLWFVAATPVAFFLCQGVIRATQTLVLAIIAWRMLPSGNRLPRVSLTLIRPVWRFAAGMGGISILGLILTQIDSVLLSRLLSLEKFGYYAVAKSISQSLYVFISPIFMALFPRFTQLVALNDCALLNQTYDRATQLLVVVVGSAGLTLAFSSHDVLWAWTGDRTLVSSTHVLVTILCLGTVINGLLNPPYALQLAYGSTRLAIWINVIAVLSIVPLIILFAPLYGATVGAVAWLAANCIMFTIFVPITHRRLLSLGLQWYLQRVAGPIAILAVVTIGAAFVAPAPLGRILSAVWVLVVFSAALISGAAFAPWLRSEVIHHTRSLVSFKTYL